MFHHLLKHPLLRLALSPQHLWRSIELGAKSIWLHKLRSLLTALGVDPRRTRFVAAEQ